MFRDGRVCGKAFTTQLPNQVLCRQCRRRLPKCRACKIIMGAQYGYAEDIGVRIGRYRVCGACYQKIMLEGKLHISNGQYLLISGKIRTTRIPQEDRV